MPDRPAQPGPADQRQLVTQIRKSTAAITDSLREILDVSKLDAGVVQPRVRSFAVAQVLDRIALEMRNLVIPVVGNLAGDHALREIGKVMTERGEKLSALYASNVEFYLMREGSFDAFAATVRALPRDNRSVIIRSYFGGGFYGNHPQSVPGYFSTQLLQTVDTFASESAKGGYGTYMDLVSKHNLPLK